MELRSLKVKKNHVAITWITREGPEGKNVHTHMLHAGDAPHPDLVAAMANLLTPCLVLLELPEKYRAECTVSTVLVSEQKGGVRGLQVNLVKSLKAGSRPLNLTTPLLVESLEPVDDEALAALHADFWDCLNAVVGEAARYVSGKRAQADLFEEGETTEQPAGELEEVHS